MRFISINNPKKHYIPVFAIILCLILSGCQRGTSGSSKFGQGESDPVSTERNVKDKTEASTADPAIASTDPSSIDTTEAPEPGDGDIYSNTPYRFHETPIETHYKSGQVVCFDTIAYMAYTDGIYKLEDGVISQLVEAQLDDMAKLCTDGYSLYYIDTYGDLWKIDVTDDMGRGILVDSGFIEGSTVEAAGRDCIYMRTPDTLDPETGVLDEWGDVYRYDTKTGDSELIMEAAYADCAGGYTYIRKESMDVSEGELLIYDYERTLWVSLTTCISVTASLDTVWFCTGSINNGYAALYYMSGEENGYTLLFESNNNGSYQYGYGVNGFLVSHMYDNGEELVNDYYDLRTGEFIPESRLTTGDGIVSGGYLAGNTAYYTTYNAVYTLENNRLTMVYQQPAEIWSFMYLCGDYLILDPYDTDAFYILEPLQ